MAKQHDAMLLFVVALGVASAQYTGVEFPDSQITTIENFEFFCATAIAPGDAVEIQTSPKGGASSELVVLGETTDPETLEKTLDFLILDSSTGQEIQRLTNTEQTIQPCIESNFTECTLRCISHIGADGTKLLTVLDLFSIFQFDLSQPAAPLVIGLSIGLGPDLIVGAPDSPLDTFLQQADYRFIVQNHTVGILYNAYISGTRYLVRAEMLCSLDPCSPFDYTLNHTSIYAGLSNAIESFEVYYTSVGNNRAVASIINDEGGMVTTRLDPWDDAKNGFEFFSEDDEIEEMLSGIPPKTDGKYLYAEVNGRIRVVDTAIATRQFFSSAMLNLDSSIPAVLETSALLLRPRRKIIDLEAGQAYSVSLNTQASSNLTEIYFALLDADLNFIHFEIVPLAESVPPLTTEIVFVAEANGTHYIALSMDLDDWLAGEESYLDSDFSYTGTFLLEERSGQPLTNLSQGPELPPLCCFYGNLLDLKLYATDNVGPLIVTSNEDGLQIWTAEGEDAGISSLVFSDFGIEGYTMYQDVMGEWRILSFQKGDEESDTAIEIWYATVQVDGDNNSQLWNALIPWLTLVNVAALVFFARRYRNKIDDPEEKDLDAHEHEASLTGTSEVIPLSRTSKALALIGYKTTPSYFAVTRYDESHGYKVPRFHFRDKSVPRNKVWLVIFLLWVGFFFSPTIDRQLFIDAFESPTETCEFPDTKHELIRLAILDELGYEEAAEHYRTMSFNLANVNQQLEAVQTPLIFNNFPNDSYVGCTESQQEQYDAVRVSLTAECEAENFCEQAFERFKTNAWDAIVSVFTSDIGVLVDYQEICAPPRGTLEPCPVDPSVITDLGTLQDLADKYQVLPTRDVPISAERTADYIAEEVDYIILLIGIGSDLYTIYAIVCVFITVPLRVHASSLWVRIKRRFFTIPQSKFIVILVALFWTVPYVVNLLERLNIWLYFYNSISDVCYTQIGFLSKISNLIIDSCTQVDELEQLHYTVGYQLREFNATINFYKDCGGTEYDALDDFFEEVDLVTEDTFLPFNATICDAEYLSGARERFALAPEPEQIGFWGILLGIGLVIRTFAKFVFTNFALSFTRTFDPLLLHDGKVETVDGQELPPLRDTVSYLYWTRLPGFWFNVVLVVIYTISLFDSTGTELAEAADPGLTAGLVCLILFFIFVLWRMAPSEWLAQSKNYRKFKSGRQNMLKNGKEKFAVASAAAAAKAGPAMSSAATKGKELMKSGATKGKEQLGKLAAGAKKLPSKVKAMRKARGGDGGE